MATYADSGVDISAGDKASRIAYNYAKSTFSSRDGLKGTPLIQDGGFAGAIDMGDYLMINCCDGVGTKIDISFETQNFAGLGHDLLAMTADDAICVGAEVISITNTIDTNKVDPNEIEPMMKSLAEICIAEKVLIPGGEIAELGKTLTKSIWNSSATGIVEKNKFITGENIEAGNAVISLQEFGFRSNGFSLVRHILKENNINFSDIYADEKTWGEVLLKPSILYHGALLNILGRFGQERKIDVKGIVHVTGGGLAGNFFRILKDKKLGANLPNIFPMTPAMNTLQKLGNVEDREAYKTWNSGNGMLLICEQNDAEKLVELLKDQNLSAQIAGEIIDSPVITHKNCGAFVTPETVMLEFKAE
jgi:phosphoribosylformylglycinamidine cyclo-ligase